MAESPDPICESLSLNDSALSDNSSCDITPARPVWQKPRQPGPKRVASSRRLASGALPVSFLLCEGQSSPGLRPARLPSPSSSPNVFSVPGTGVSYLPASCLPCVSQGRSKMVLGQVFEFPQYFAAPLALARWPSSAAPVERWCRSIDPFGHSWNIHTHVKDVSPEETQSAMSANG